MLTISALPSSSMPTTSSKPVTYAPASIYSPSSKMILHCYLSMFCKPD
jgi:hypothetical protein